ncbi:MAG: MoaD family protein [Thermoplasmata archaeon]|nr:MAG: MoaD family protein [Thermoplasmata archaeon]
MRIKVKLLKPFSDIAGKDEMDLDFEGENIQNALDGLCELYPNLRKELFNEKGDVDFNINIFINDKPMTAEDDTTTNLSEGDILLIFMPVAGG